MGRQGDLSDLGAALTALEREAARFRHALAGAFPATVLGAGERPA
jgi:hypothetical protein